MPARRDALDDGLSRDYIEQVLPRIIAFRTAFPEHRAAHPWPTVEAGRWVLYAVWLTGAQYAGNGLYGCFPPRFLSYLLALFPEVRLRDVLHAFSGSLKPGPWTRLDIRPSIDVREGVTVTPEVVGSVYDAPELLAGRRFKLVIADPPYSATEAKHYGTNGVISLKATTALAQVLEPGGHLAWLAQDWPMHTKKELVTVGRFYLQPGTGRKARVCTLLQRVAA